MKKKKIIVFLFILFIIVLAVLFGFYKYHHDRYFSTARWVNAQKNERADMMDNLLERYEFKGMTKGEIRAVLGQPEYEKEQTDTYIVGYFFPAPDPYVLTITYENDTAAEWELSES